LKKNTILVVEDEENLLAAIKYNLDNEGYLSITANNGTEAIGLVSSEDPDLVILDVMLPELDGLEVCRIIRKDNDVPIIFLTAKDQEMDRVVGLELGADDYVVKPFSMRELLARVKAMLRRQRVKDSFTKDHLEEVLVSGSLSLNTASRILTRDGEILDIKPRAFDLLLLLMQNKGRAFSREQILERLWGTDFYGDTRTVDVHIRWIREKIEDDPSDPTKLKTVRSIGYRFEA
tara:strand:- start:3041 stop:3739 length:699 start_codon:yes stop_codon:yes gene_type:complete